MVALPVLFVACALSFRRQRRSCVVWLGCTLGAIVLGSLLRLVFTASGGALHGFWHLTPYAPSGHAIVATLVYGVLAAAHGSHGRRGALPAAAAVALIAAIDITRVTLGYHSVGDILAGLLTAAPFALVAARAMSIGERAGTGWLFTACCLVLGAMMLTGIRLDSNTLL